MPAPLFSHNRNGAWQSVSSCSALCLALVNPSNCLDRFAILEQVGHRDGKGIQIQFLHNGGGGGRMVPGRGALGLGHFRACLMQFGEDKARKDVSTVNIKLWQRCNSYVAANCTTPCCTSLCNLYPEKQFFFHHLGFLPPRPIPKQKQEPLPKKTQSCCAYYSRQGGWRIGIGKKQSKNSQPTIFGKLFFGGHPRTMQSDSQCIDNTFGSGHTKMLAGGRGGVGRRGLVVANQPPKHKGLKGKRGTK